MKALYQNVLHPTDLKENHFEMCRKAYEIAKRMDAKFYLMHVVEPPSALQLAQGLGFAEVMPPAIDAAKAVMATVADALELPEEQVFVESGSVKAHIFDRILLLPCDLLIVGKHSGEKLPSFIGSITHTTIHHAPCDILTLQNS